jgi:hypothetical protein
MFDPISLVAGGVLLTGGWLAGRRGRTWLTEWLNRFTRWTEERRNSRFDDLLVERYGAELKPWWLNDDPRNLTVQQIRQQAQSAAEQYFIERHQELTGCSGETCTPHPDREELLPRQLRMAGAARRKFGGHFYCDTCQGRVSGRDVLEN